MGSYPLDDEYSILGYQVTPEDIWRTKFIYACFYVIIISMFFLHAFEIYYKYYLCIR